MIRIAAATAALLLAGTAIVHAQSVDDQINSFINSDGFDAIDTVPLDIELAEQWLDSSTISPGGLVGPIEKAMLIADTAIPSTRTRTAIAYGEIIDEEDGAPLPYSFIEVRHYNLGQLIRAETVAAYGEGDVADEAAFGVGDHMAWRFVFRPEMGNAALLLSASQKVISDKTAAKQDCAGRPCLDLASGFDDRADWEELPGSLNAWPLQYADRADGVTRPALAISQIAAYGFWASSEGGYYQWTGGEHPEAARGYEPYRFIDIDRNLGQESTIDVVWRETKLNDDDLYAVSFRRFEIADQFYWFRSSEPRR